MIRKEEDSGVLSPAGPNHRTTGWGVVGEAHAWKQAEGPGQEKVKKQ